MKKMFGFSIKDSSGNFRCGKCGKTLGSDDYCRYCGAKRGIVRYIPRKDNIQCVYGPPPVSRLHTCSSCGFEWRTHTMIDRQQYCPKCGGSAPPIKINDENEEGK